MKKQIVSTNKAPGAIGPYSQAICIDKFVYTSGQIPVDPATGEVPANVEAQAEQSLKNLKAVLEAAGTDMDHVIKTLVFIKDMNDFAAINEVYSKFFTKDFPARSCVEAARLPKDVLIEIEAIAVKE
jgi:2-iminobutanoate/2-iminopropanoate deaminase